MKSLRLGRIEGIDVKVHPTFALIALWVLYHWGVQERGGLVGILYGLTLVLTIFFFVLLHELGHSLMAHEYGLRVRDITLVPFGGVARIEQMPTRPRAEAMIALAGPMLNVAVAIVLMPVLVLAGIASGFDSAGDFTQYTLSDVSITGFIFYIFLANLTLALFNLLPAFPMDGGRLLRAGLSTILGRNTATDIAVWLGISLGAAIALFGIYTGEILIALVMSFVVAAAIAEGRSMHLEESMRRLRVGQFATWDRGGVSPKDPIALALRQGPRDLAVTVDGQLVGMIWRHQLVDVIHQGGLHRRVAEIMDSEIVTAGSDLSVLEVHNLMNQHNQWSMPIIDGGHYRGLFTTERLLHVQRHLHAQAPERRHFATFTGALSHTWRSWVG